MKKVRVSCFTISTDGFGAGPKQDLKNPLGIGGTTLHEWFFPTKTFQKGVLGKDGGASGVDDDIAARGMAGIGAWILGRNMFGPRSGRAGGVTNRRITRPSSSSRTTRGRRWR